MYIKVFVKIYNWQNKRLIHETYKIIQLEKDLISKIDNLLNLGSQQLYNIFESLPSVYI